MHATRYDSDAPPSADPLDAALGADNDNDALPEEDAARAVLPRSILPRWFARRDWITAALLLASNGLTAWAWTHPRGGRSVEPPPVTRVEVPALAAAVVAPPPPIVVPDLPPFAAPSADPHVREHGVRREVAPASGGVAPVSGGVAPPAAAARHEAETPAAAETAEAADEATEATPASGALDEALERASNDHAEETEACIQDADDDAQGSITVRLVIARDGSVRSATPRAPASLRSVGRCLADAMRGWSVEVPGARGDMTATLPFEVESNAE